MQSFSAPPRWLGAWLGLSIPAGEHLGIYFTLISWMEPVFVVLLSAIFISIFCLFTRWQIRRAMGQENQLDLALPDFGPIDDHGVSHILLGAAGNYHGITQKYLLWLRDGYLRKTIRKWISACWIVPLWLFLALPALHSPVLEWVGSASATQNRIFNVRAYIDDATLSSREVFPLDRDREAGAWTVTPEIAAALAIWEKGTLQLSAGDWPHMHRFIKVHCLPPNCWLSGNGNSKDLRFPVQAGRVQFDFGKFPTEPLKIDMAVQTWWGRELQLAKIEQR
jgi:hypothetical protein